MLNGHELTLAYKLFVPWYENLDPCVRWCASGTTCLPTNSVHAATYLRLMPPVRNRVQLVQVLQANAAGIKAFGVDRLGVFGSFARDTATSQSDVDLFVEFAPERRTLKDLMGLSRYLEERLGRKVELVTPGALNPFTGKYILQEVQYVALAA